MLTYETLKQGFVLVILDASDSLSDLLLKLLIEEVGPLVDFESRPQQIDQIFQSHKRKLLHELVLYFAEEVARIFGFRSHLFHGRQYQQVRHDLGTNIDCLLTDNILDEVPFERLS